MISRAPAPSSFCCSSNHENVGVAVLCVLRALRDKSVSLSGVCPKNAKRLRCGPHVPHSQIIRRVAGPMLDVRKETVCPWLARGARLELAQVERVLGERGERAYERPRIVRGGEDQAGSRRGAISDHRRLS